MKLNIGLKRFFSKERLSVNKPVSSVASMLVGCVLSGSAISTHAMASGDFWQPAVDTVSASVIKPGYSGLASNLSLLGKEVDAFCADPSEQTMAKARFAWKQSILSWMEVSWVHFGPVSNGSTRFDIQIWPIRKGITHKTVNTLVAMGDELKAEDIDQKGVSIRGITGSEYLLFSGSGGQLKHYQAADAKQRCMVLKRSVENSLVSVNKLNKDWQSPSVLAPFKMGVDMLDATKEYESAASIVWNALLSELEFIQLRKLEGPLNEHGKKAKPTFAESWRSLHSFENIAHQLATLKQVYTFGFEPMIKASDAALNQQVVSSFDQLQMTLSGFKQPLKKLVATEDGRQQLIAFRDEIRKLYTLLRNQVTPLTGFVLGFNANDGD
ncbi:imelysin family protein [Litoribacillus peritrichatus]|uniref:Imelysin family protein n=1 Tax=Litoribacillus peritrichatus TaxID=718191 RepID=A0ABP7MXH2_9GAMM